MILETDSNPQLKLAFDFVQFTGKNIFLTGKAGTGKTTFLHNLKKKSPKRMIVVAPTGVAAINAGGVTIHSFFQMPYGPYIPDYAEERTIFDGVNSRRVPAHLKRFSREKINIIKSLDLLVIDEVSMVRADLLDGIDEVLRRYKNRARPFGGVQLLMIGDLQQLAPIVKEDEWELLKPYYANLFFFSSRVLQETHYISIELTHIFRQRDKYFIELLNEIRDNKANKETLEKLNERYDKNFNPDKEEGYITLTTHNRQAQNINESKLEKLPAKKQMFKATIEGDFPDHLFPTEEELWLKKGAQVMFVKNDPSREKLFYNGKIGTITGFGEDSIYVTCPDSDQNIVVEPLVWQNMKYSINDETKEIEETEIGSFTQYPLKLAWAITIHKSQGLTFEKAIIDARAAFAHGQVYVALSRCTTLEGLVLSTPIASRAIISDTTVHRFTKDIEGNPPNHNVLNESKIEYQKDLLNELFDFSFLKWNIYTIIKILKEHSASIIGKGAEPFEDMNRAIKQTILEVADKFVTQRELLIREQKNIEENKKLQERVKKACVYFLEKLDGLALETTDNFSFETDNKTLRKNIKSAIQKFREAVMIKKACLEISRQGFSVKEYLNIRAKSAIEKPAKKQKEKKIEVQVTDEIYHPVLFKRMKEWRMHKAIESGLPAYMILHQKALLGIVNLLPQTISQLKKIKGVGKKKAEQYGNEMISLVVDYCNDKNIAIAQEQEHEPEEERKPAKKDTKQISFELLEAGNTIEEIAAGRGMAVSTIEGHLAHFVGTGDLDIKQFVSPEKISLITDYFIGNDTTLLRPAKEALGENVTWGELRFVLKHLECNRK